MWRLRGFLSLYSYYIRPCLCRDCVLCEDESCRLSQSHLHLAAVFQAFPVYQSVLSASTGSLRAAIPDGMRPAMNVRKILMSIRTAAPTGGRTALVLLFLSGSGESC